VLPTARFGTNGLLGDSRQKENAMPITDIVDFHLLSKQRWNEEMARIVKATKTSQKRLAEWSPELTR
jgi:hypothetical protein